MKTTGPSITALTHRLTMTPPVLMTAKPLDTPALVIDTFFDLGLDLPDEKSLGSPSTTPAHDRANHQVLVHLACFLLHDPWFAAKAIDGARLREFLFAELGALAAVAPADRFVNDPDGREELARRCLSALDLLPEGETAAQAEDRLRAVDSIERRRVIEKTHAARKRAEEIREAIARREAEEAASKMMRE